METRKTSSFKTADSTGKAYSIEAWTEYHSFNDNPIPTLKWLEWEGHDVIQTGDHTYEIMADDRVICVTGPNALDSPPLS